MKILCANLIGAVLCGGLGYGQEKEVDPFNNKEWHMARVLSEAPDNWEVMWEVFSVPFSEATKMRREMKDQGKIYGELLKRVEKKKAVLEEFVVLKGTVGVSSETESIEEYIYSTESEPPEVPNEVRKVPENPKVAELLMTPAMPAAFDTRNVGRSLEIEIVEKVSPKVIRVELKFDRVSLIDLLIWGQKKSMLKMPRFANHGIKKDALLSEGIPTLVGTMSPPKKDAGKERMVWLAFATATGEEK